MSYRLIRPRALDARIVRDGTISSAAGELDRSSVELVTVTVGDAHGASGGTQLGTNDTKLAREAFSFIDRVFRILEDHTALVFELRTDDEIKIEVWHCPAPSQVSIALNLT